MTVNINCKLVTVTAVKDADRATWQNSRLGGGDVVVIRKEPGSRTVMFERTNKSLPGCNTPESRRSLRF